MVQLLLGGKRRAVALLLVLCAAILVIVPLRASKSKAEKAIVTHMPELELLGGRKLTFERVFGNEREVKPNRGFWNKVLDVVAGEPEFHSMVRPYSIATDSRGRIIVTDPDV